MNNKGQTLILFVLLIPLIFILLSLIVDIGFLYAEKIKVNSGVKVSLNSALTGELPNNQSIEERVIYLINRNIDDAKIEKIKYENSIMYITVSKKYKTMFAKILNRKSYDIVVSYKAYVENERIIIKKE